MNMRKAVFTTPDGLLLDVRFVAERDVFRLWSCKDLPALGQFDHPRCAPLVRHRLKSE